MVSPEGSDPSGAPQQPTIRAPGGDRLCAGFRDHPQHVIVGRTDGVGRGSQVLRVGVAKGEEIHDHQARMPSGSGPGDTSIQRGSVPPFSVTGCGVEQHPYRCRCEIDVSPPPAKRLPETPCPVSRGTTPADHRAKGLHRQATRVPMPVARRGRSPLDHDSLNTGPFDSAHGVPNLSYP